MELLIVLVVAVAALLAVRVIGRVTVYEYERGVRYRGGRLDGVVGPGGHWVFRPTTEIRRVDVRARSVAVPGQEMLTSDGVAVKMTVIARYAIADPAAATNAVQSYVEAIYAALQIALRQIVAQATIEDLLAGRGEIGARLQELTEGELRAFGVTLVRADVRDLMLPGDLKRLFAQVVQAQKEGQATLERARGETAALRNLANAAQLVESNPALMQLRLLQQISASTGNTFVIGVPDGAAAVRNGGSEPRG